jgi:VWFA-related protein
MRRFPAASIVLWLMSLALGSLALAAPARCQEAPPGPLQPKPGVVPEKVPGFDEQHAIKSRVNEVTAPVTVRDPTGEIVLSLAKNNFHVYDNGVEQKIDHFDLGGDPLSIVLAIETSSHVEPMLPAIRKTGIIFTQTVMALTSEAALIGFDDGVNLLQTFTTDPDIVQAMVNGLPEGTSGSHVYDAMARGISLLSQRPPARRRILVVFGEAQDTGSEIKLGSVLRQAELANVTIYSIGLSTAMADLRAKPDQYEPPQLGPPGTFPIPTPDGQPQTPELEAQMEGNINVLALAEWLVKTGMNAVGSNSLEVASKATGGLHVSTMKDHSFQKAMDEIGGELHAEYTLGYRPPSDEVDGYHEIKITVDRPGLTVRTRPGYYLPPPPG